MPRVEGLLSHISLLHGSGMCSHPPSCIHLTPSMCWALWYAHSIPLNPHPGPMMLVLPSPPHCRWRAEGTGHAYKCTARILQGRPWTLHVGPEHMFFGHVTLLLLLVFIMWKCCLMFVLCPIILSSSLKFIFFITQQKLVSKYYK